MIGDFKSLQVLDLRYSQLTSLPESIGNLMNLKKQINKLTKFSQSVNNLLKRGYGIDV